MRALASKISRATLLGVSPLLSLLTIGVFSPLIQAAWLSLHQWDQSAGRYASRLSLRNYVEVFAPHRGGVALRCFLISLGTGVVLLSIALPPLIVLRLKNCARQILAFELALIVPIFVSPILRLHSLSLLLTASGPVGRHVSDFFALSMSELLYTDVGASFGIASVFVPQLILPVVQQLRSIPDTTIWSMSDCSFSLTRRVVLASSYARSGVFAGLVLFVVSSWASTLEHRIVGTGNSIQAALEQLVGADKQPEAFALAIVPFVCSLALFVVVARSGQFDSLVAGKAQNVRLLS